MKKTASRRTAGGDETMSLASIYNALWQIDFRFPFRLDAEDQRAVDRVMQIIQWLRSYSNHDEDAHRATLAKHVLSGQGDPVSSLSIDWRPKPTYRQMLIYSQPINIARLTDREEQIVWKESGGGPYQETKLTPRRCAGTTKAGKPCRCRALFRQPVCWRHGGDRARAQADLLRVGEERVREILNEIADPAQRLACAAVIQTEVKPERLKKGTLAGVPKWKQALWAKKARAATRRADPAVQLAVAASKAVA